ncbi:hypothetical protein IPF37_01210 [bacterium]|nr:MAG: hypothetical protein IPF37_01210 [bacterium]
MSMMKSNQRWGLFLSLILVATFGELAARGFGHAFGHGPGGRPIVFNNTKELEEKEKERISAEWQRNHNILKALPEDTIIAIRSNPKGPGKGKFLAVVDGKYLKAVHDSLKKVNEDQNAQFKILRHGDIFGLQQVAAPHNNLQSVKDSFEVSFENQNFDDDHSKLSLWFIEVTGSLNKQVWFKNAETDGYLSVRQEPWSNGGRLYTRDHRVVDGKAQPARKDSWETFSIVIIKSVGVQATEQAREVDADDYPFKEGNIVVLRSHPKSPGQGKYLNIVDGKFLAPGVENSDNKNSRFKVLREGYFVGFEKLTEPKFRLQSSPVLQVGEDNPPYSVQFQNAAFMKWEHWQPVKMGSEEEGYYWVLQNEATGGYLSVRSESWSRGRVWTRGKSNKPAKSVTQAEKFIVEVIKDTGLVSPEPSSAKPAPAPATSASTATPGSTVVVTPAPTVIAGPAVVKPKVLSEEEKEKRRLQLEKDIAGIIPTPRDTAALQSLKAGTVVAIKVVSTDKAGKYLRLEDGQYLMPTGSDSKEPQCRFVVMRLGNWIGFKSYHAAGNTLSAAAKTHEVLFSGDAFQKDENTRVHWALVPAKDDSLGVVQLHNQASGGFLNILSRESMRKGHRVEKIDEDKNLAAMGVDKTVPAEIDDEDDNDHKSDELHAIGFGRLWTKKDRKGRAATPDLASTKFTIEIVQPVGAETVAGGAAFTYIPELYQQRTVAYHEKWKLAEAGYGWVKFKARALEGLAIAFAATMNPANGPAYEVQIGHTSNTKSAIFKDGKSVFEISADDAGNSDADVSGGLPFEGQAWDDYWVMINESGKVSAGKGTEIGQRSFIEWKDTKPATDVRYVGLSDLSSRAEFKNITFSPARPVQPKFIVPVGFSKVETNKRFVKITTGSHQGSFEAWAVDKDGKLYHDKNGGLSGDDWQVVALLDQQDKDLGKVKDVAAGDDGVVYVVTDSGLVYTFIREGQNTLRAPRANKGPVVPVPAVVVKPVLDVVALTEKVAQKEEARGKIISRSAKAKNKKARLARKKATSVASKDKKSRRRVAQKRKVRKPLKKAASLRDQRVAKKK